ncbi:MAG TPA: hypothetical protein VH117_10510 [Edaphobacter sp.]|jgi:hypothetical protein|nr:hypothetical protein [Edaphobacter sp.]
MTLALLDDGETVTPTPMSIPTHRVELMHGGEVRTYAHVAPSGSVDVASLRGMTQIKALEKIARHNGGRLLTSDAKRYLVQAGLIKNPKNANNIIFSVIQRSNQFERLEPGVYRLTADKPIRPDKTLTGSLGLE